MDGAVLWLWHRPAVTVLIRPLPGDPPWAAGAALEKTKKKKKKNGKWQIVTIKMIKINHLKSFALKHSSLL